MCAIQTVIVFVPTTMNIMRKIYREWKRERRIIERCLAFKLYVTHAFSFPHRLSMQTLLLVFFSLVLSMHYFIYFGTFYEYKAEHAKHYRSYDAWDFSPTRGEDRYISIAFSPSLCDFFHFCLQIFFRYFCSTAPSSWFKRSASTQIVSYCLLAMQMLVQFHAI